MYILILINLIDTNDFVFVFVFHACLAPTTTGPVTTTTGTTGTTGITSTTGATGTTVITGTTTGNNYPIPSCDTEIVMDEYCYPGQPITQQIPVNGYLGQVFETPNFDGGYGYIYNVSKI